MVVSTTNPEPNQLRNFAARATVDPYDSGRSFRQSPRQTTEGLQRCRAVTTMENDNNDSKDRSNNDNNNNQHNLQILTNN